MSYHAKVSVIVPVYNADFYLNQAIESICNQSLDDLEIILLNDGSTDNSLDIMRHHAQKDKRIRIIDKQNQGYGATCNCGMDEANGDYIAIVEPDDWIEPNMYKEMLDYANTFNELIDIIKTPYWRIWMPDTSRQRKINCSYYRRIKPANQPFTIDDPGAVHLLCHHPSIWSALYRRQFLQDAQLRFMEIPGAGWADNPFLIESLCKAQNIVYLDKNYYCYREETPEKSRTFALHNTLLPFERWNDMKDVLEHLGVTDKGIQRAHNSRGFTYLDGILKEVDLSHGEVREATKHMFKRMDPNLVLTDPEISPVYKRLFIELQGLPKQSISALPYLGGLLKQGIYNLKNTGVLNTIFTTINYFKKKKSREGRK